MHRATCSCGQLQLTCEGEPVRISICHCIACQRRTGSAFGYQARYPAAQILDIKGQAKQFTRTADSGNRVTSNFCAECGSTVYWTLESAPGLVAVAIGALADANFPPPRHSVYERHRHRWVSTPPGIEHLE
jgi:hypothetical protein